jgi:hypothetical protein
MPILVQFKRKKYLLNSWKEITMAYLHQSENASIKVAFGFIITFAQKNVEVEKCISYLVLT